MMGSDPKPRDGTDRGLPSSGSRNGSEPQEQQAKHYIVMASISRPLTGQALEETEIPSVYPAEELQFNMPRSAKNRSKSAQRQKPNLSKDNALPDLAKVNSSAENQRESLPQGEQLEERAMAAPCAAGDNIGPSESIVHELDKEMNVSCPVSIFESFDALSVAEKADLHSLSEAYASAFLERSESLNQSPLSYKTLPLKLGQIDAGDHQQMESSVGLWSREKAMLFKKDLPETLNPDQLVGSMRKKTHSTSLNDRLKMRRPVSFQGSTSKSVLKEFIVEVEQSNKVAAANAESIQAMQHTAISSPAHYRHPNHPQHQLNHPIDLIAPPSTGFQSIIKTLMDQSSSCNDFVNSNPPGQYDLDGVVPPCNCFINSNPFGYYNLDEEPCTKASSVNHSPKFGFTVTTTDLNSRCYTGQLYGLSAAERSFVSPPSKQLHDQSLAISSDSPTLSFGTESSPSPYSSPESPYDGRAHVRTGQHAGTGRIPLTSSNTSFWPTKTARAHSFSNLVGTSSPDSVPYFQLEDDVLIMDGVLVESQRPLQHACTDCQQRAGKSIPEVGFLGSPSFLPKEHSGSVHFPEARSRQYIAKELMGPDDRLLHRGQSEGYIFSGDSTDSSSTTPSKMKSESLSKTIKGSRCGASSEGTSNAEKCSTARHVNLHEPPEYSPELVRAFNLPENLDFLYEIAAEDTTSSTAEQYDSSSPSQSISSFSSLSKSAPLFSSKTMPPPCMKEMESTPQSCPPTNMLVSAPKFSATSPARSSPPFHKHAIEAPPFKPAKGTSFRSTEVETDQSPVKSSPFLAKTVVALQATPRTPRKSTSPPFTGNSSSHKSVGARAAPRTSPAKSSTQPAQSPARRSPSLPTSAAKASPYTPVKGSRPTSSKVSNTPITIMASPAKRPPLYPKTITPPPSPAKYSSS